MCCKLVQLIALYILYISLCCGHITCSQQQTDQTESFTAQPMRIYLPIWDKNPLQYATNTSSNENARLQAAHLFPLSLWRCRLWRCRHLWGCRRPNLKRSKPQTSLSPAFLPTTRTGSGGMRYKWYILIKSQQIITTNSLINKNISFQVHTSYKYWYSFIHIPNNYKVPFKFLRCWSRNRREARRRRRKGLPQLNSQSRMINGER